MAGRMLRELCITKACPTFLTSSERSWLAGITIRALYYREDSRTRCQEILGRSAVAATDWKDTSHDLGGIADTYPLEGHQLRFDSRHRRSAYEDDTPVTIWSSSSTTSFRRCYATSRCRYRLMHPSFPTRSTETQSSPPSSGARVTTFELDYGYHLRISCKDIGPRSRFN